MKDCLPSNDGVAFDQLNCFSGGVQSLYSANSYLKHTEYRIHVYGNRPVVGVV